MIVNSDKELRDALSQSKGKLKLHTTLTDGKVISATEIAGRQMRSHSVPPAVDRGYQSYPPANSRSPSSIDSATTSFRNRTLSPPPTPLTTHQKQPPLPLGPGIQMKPPGYGYSYSTYGPYSQNLVYGMPPHSGMLLSTFCRFLESPFPFDYHRSFVGPNKYHHFGGPWGGYKNYSGWGSVW
ncbi:unnamed protein product [Strongylus vulgaris]|uniref:Uncharacterized protein n=1 Tax=Strongylus vulgaris TaxID=40348 RepID=A0A3P7L599_STRVU|nr:unnamed protein product [Strongylus vulgaris]